MVRRFSKMVLAAGLAAAAAFGTPSCADNHESIFIRGVIRIESPDCVAKPDSGAVLLAEGVLDVKLGSSYTAALMVGNQLIRRARTDIVRAEPNRVQISGADISLQDVSGKELVPAYSVTAQGTIDPSTGGDPTYGAIFVPIIPTDPALALSAAIGAGKTLTVNAHIVVYGQTIGLTDVKSGEFVFPITVTNGGTIVKPCDTTGVCSCKVIPANFNYVASCYAGQDVSQNPCALVCNSNPSDPICL